MGFFLWEKARYPISHFMYITDMIIRSTLTIFYSIVKQRLAGLWFQSLWQHKNADEWRLSGRGSDETTC